MLSLCNQSGQVEERIKNLWSGGWGTGDGNRYRDGKTERGRPILLQKFHLISLYPLLLYLLSRLISVFLLIAIIPCLFRFFQERTSKITQQSVNQMLLTEFFQDHCPSAWALLWNDSSDYFKVAYTLLAPDSPIEPGQWGKKKKQMFLSIAWLPPLLASWLAFQLSWTQQWYTNFSSK